MHGGPHSVVELGIEPHVYWYALCARGWSVLALNATGSSSYGTASAHELRARWGERDLSQHMEAVAALQREGAAGGAVAFAGKSYGGYLAAWAASHEPSLAAVVVSAPVANLESHAGTSDSGDYVAPWDMRGEPWEKRELYRALSPVQHAHRAQVPMLLLQGEADERCPKGQSEELFAIVKRAGRAEVEMVLYPHAHHDLAEAGRPSHRLDYHRRIVEWLERHRAQNR